MAWFQPSGRPVYGPRLERGQRPPPSSATFTTLPATRSPLRATAAAHCGSSCTPGIPWLTRLWWLQVGLTSFGAFFMLLGVIMLFDGPLIALGNVSPEPTSCRLSTETQALTESHIPAVVLARRSCSCRGCRSSSGRERRSTFSRDETSCEGVRRRFSLFGYRSTCPQRRAG